LNYGALISEAFWLTWRNRFLWIFGFFLGGGQVFNLLQNANNLGRPETVSFLGDNAALFVLGARRLILDNLVLFLGLAVALALIGIFLALVSQGALIDSVAGLHRGEERRFSWALRAGLSNFWRLLRFFSLFVLIGFGIGLFVLLLTIFLLVGSLTATDSSNVRIMSITLIILLLVGVILLISIPLGIIYLLGQRALVLDREGVFGSFRSGYRLLIRCPGRVLLVAIIFFVLSLGVSIALLILVLLLGLLLAVPALILFMADLSTASIVVGVVAAVVLLIAFLVASATIATFNHAYWTLAYLQLTTPTEGATL
jgi:hypothetical protein